MLLPADADLVQRDRGLRGFGTLLDPDAFATALASRLRDASPGSARLTHLRYKPSWSCLAAYEVEVAGRPIDVYAKALARDAGLEFAAAQGELGTPHPKGIGRFVIPERSIVICLYPDDLRIADLDLVIDRDARAVILHELLPQRDGAWTGAASRLAYRPERRHVLRVHEEAGPGVVLKVYARKGFAAAERSARRVRPGDALRLPPVLAASERVRTIATGWVEGTSLRDVVRGESPLAVPLASVGAALAELHAQAPALPRRSRRAELQLLRSRAISLGFLLPAIGERAVALATGLAARLARCDGDLRCIHGDFYDKQVVLDGRGATLLDLDQAGLGDGEADLGLFLAHLALDVELGRLEPSRAFEAGTALLDGYRAHAPARSPGLYAAAGMLELASYAFRRRDPDWPDVLQRMLARAEDQLALAPDAAAP